MTQPLNYGRSGVAPAFYYRHSGIGNLKSIVLGLGVAIPFAVVGGVFYAFIVRALPIIELMTLICIGYGFVAGFVAGQVMRWVKVRNFPSVITLVVLITALSYYISWIAWITSPEAAAAIEEAFKAMEPAD